VVEVGKDVDGEIISSCVVVPADVPKIVQAGPKLTKNQQTMYSILRDAGQGGLTTDEWSKRVREVGVGTKRKADIYDARRGLKAKNIVRGYADRWNAF
jgi:Fe2+ or Zn2+ uptake regulation protein